MSVVRDIIGHAPDGGAIERFVLQGPRVRAEIMTFGATLMRLFAPDRAGALSNVVLGSDSAALYLTGTPYFGATIGRYANRIAGARFSIDGVAYTLSANEGAHLLHGGHVGFDKVNWRAVARADAVTFSHRAEDADQGFPGAVDVQVTYRLTDDGFALDYEAASDKPTHLNLTHHSYFNLSGDPRRSIEDHVLQIEADSFTPVDATLIPTGEVRPVQNTTFDFRAPRRIGDVIDASDPQLRIGRGFDHNFVLRKERPGSLSRAARVEHRQSGRTLTLHTTEPGLQFYSGNALQDSGFTPRSALCLEPQHFPDSPNQPAFPSTLLRPGQTFRSQTRYAFGVVN